LKNEVSTLLGWFLGTSIWWGIRKMKRPKGVLLAKLLHGKKDAWVSLRV